MHVAAAVLVVTKRLERQRAERRAFLGEHGGDLPLGRAVNARIGPALLPAVQIRLAVVEALEAESAQRRLLGVADGGFDLALAIGVADATRQGDDPVVGQHVAVERIERRVVDVRGEDALLEVVEHDDAHGASQPSERPLVQFGPDLRARPLDQQPHGLARVAQGQDEEPCPPVLAGVRVTDHRSLAVVDLCFLRRGGGDDHPSLDGGLLPNGRDEAPHARIARRESMVIDQVLPDGHGVAPPAKRFDDQLTVGFAGARPRRSTGALPGPGGGGTRARTGRGCHRRVGGHLRRNGRFCRTSGRAATAPHRQAGRLQVAAGGFARTPVASSIRRSDQPRRPSARTCCRFSAVKTLLMPGRNVPFPTGVNVSGRYPKWPVFKCPSMAGFGCPPRLPGQLRAEARGGDRHRGARGSAPGVVQLGEVRREGHVVELSAVEPGVEAAERVGVGPSGVRADGGLDQAARGRCRTADRGLFGVDPGG